METTPPSVPKLADSHCELKPTFELQLFHRLYVTTMTVPLRFRASLMIN
jgi:hypothetical protein